MTVTDTSTTSRIGKFDSPECQLDYPISLKTTAAPGHRHKQEAPKDGSPADESGGNQGRTGPRSETSANDEAKLDAEKGLEEVAAEQNNVPEVKTDTKTEAGTNSR
jgi:hypothetical protein